MMFLSCYTFLFFFLFTIHPISTSSSSLSYSNHCSSVVPESTPTTRSYSNPVPFFRTSYFTGGNKLLAGKKSDQTYYYGAKSLRFRPGRNFYKTKAKGIYKIESFLHLRTPYRYYHEARSNYGYGGSYHNTSRSRGPGTIIFSLNGFWSEISRNLCMVGSASWQVDDGKTVNLDAVLKLNFAAENNPTVYNSVVSGYLESTSSEKNDKTYFDPIMIFSFPEISKYNYSLVSKELDGGFSGVSKDGFISLEQSSFCRLMNRISTFLELEHEIDGFSQRFLHLNSIQCSEDDKKLRYVLKFQNFSYRYEDFRIDSTLIGEASWDNEKNQLDIIACRIVNPINRLRDAVRDCTLRLSLRYTSIWTIRDEAKIVGQIWTIKSDDDGFKKINLTSTDVSSIMDFPGLRYEYTELDKAKKSCPVKKTVKKGQIYPDGHSYDMGFDVSVKNSKGDVFAWGYVTPLFVGNEMYKMNNGIVAVDYLEPSFETGFATISEPERGFVRLNMSYKLSISPYYNGIEFGNWFSTHNSSKNLRARVEISAEGVYNTETGQLCMVGCIKLQNTTDCEIFVNFQFAPSNGKGDNPGLTNGTIRSTRSKNDNLYFEDLSLLSTAFTTSVAKRSIWRMDLEITMVLISNTFSCIFIGLQLLHVKRNPETLSCISILMLVILSLGHMIPLVLNFEALFFENRDKKTVMLSTGGWVEANEVAIRVVTMVAFLLQIRLLQLVSTAKTSHENEKGSWAREKKPVFISLVMYISTGLVALLLKQTSLRSYIGLVFDGFLVPQIIFNVFRGSAEKALCRSFYIGTSAIRLVPHAYDQYRAHNYPKIYVNGTYFYANHGGDFYSTAWDVLIPFGVVALAVIVFLQQWRGGRIVVPMRFREVELYENVPNDVVNE